MKLKYILFTISILFIAQKSIAQELSKQEKKALKKELKTYLKTPQKFIDLKADIENKEAALKQQAEDLRKVNFQKKVVERENKSLVDSLSFYKAEVKKMDEKLAVAQSCRDDKGYKFRVQIGLYKEYDVSEFLEEMKFTTFEEANGMFRYTIGNFDTEPEAELFKLAMRKLGIRDAFVAYYLDGKRIAK